MLFTYDLNGEQNTAKAKEYYKRRVDYVKQNAEGVQQTMLGKQNMKKGKLPCISGDGMNPWGSC